MIAGRSDTTPTPFTPKNVERIELAGYLTST